MAFRKVTNIAECREGRGIFITAPLCRQVWMSVRAPIVHDAGGTTADNGIQHYLTVPHVAKLRNDLDTVC